MIKKSLYATGPYNVKYQFLINKIESTGLKHFNDSKAFVWILKWYGWYFKNFEECKLNKKCKILIVSGDDCWYA